MRTYPATVAATLVLFVTQVFAQPPVSPATPQPPAQQQADTAKPPPAPLKHVHVELAGFELDKPAAAGTSTQIGGGTRAIGGVTTLLAPRFCKLFAPHPVFRWSHTTQAQQFEFRLFDAKGNPVYSAQATGREFRYPDDAPALEPGTVYAWNVRPESSLLGGVSQTARFVRLPRSEIDELSTAFNRMAADGTDDAERRAQLLVDRRLWFDAVEALTNLIKEHPTDPRFFEQRATIYDQIPATRPLAEEDFAVASKLRGSPGQESWM